MASHLSTHLRQHADRWDTLAHLDPIETLAYLAQHPPSRLLRHAARRIEALERCLAEQRPRWRWQTLHHVEPPTLQRMFAELAALGVQRTARLQWTKPEADHG